LAKKEDKGYSPKTVAKNTVGLLEEGVEPENINKLFKDAVEDNKKLGWIDNKIETLEENGVDIDTINDFIEKSPNPYGDLRHLNCKVTTLVALGINKDNINKIIKNSKNIKEIYNCKEELKKLKKMGINKENLNKIIENLKDIKDITKLRKTVGELKRRKISKEAINKLIENGYDLEKVKEVIINLRNKGVPAKVIDDLIKKGYSLKEISALSSLKGKIDFKDIEKLASIKNPDNPSQYVLQKVLREIIKNKNKANDIAFELKTAARLIDKGEKVIKFSMNEKGKEIDVLTDKAVYECKNIRKDASRKAIEDQINKIKNQYNKLPESLKTEKEFIPVFPKNAIKNMNNRYPEWKNELKNIGIKRVALISKNNIEYMQIK